MKWSNLKNNRCPECNKDFTKGLEITPGGRFKEDGELDMNDNMLHHPCGFMITESKYKEIISSQVIKNLNL